jgi:hypothetical protein
VSKTKEKSKTSRSFHEVSKSHGVPSGDLVAIASDNKTSGLSAKQNCPVSLPQSRLGEGEEPTHTPGSQAGSAAVATQVAPEVAGGTNQKVDKLPETGSIEQPSAPSKTEDSKPGDGPVTGGSGVIRSGKTREEQDEILRRLQARSVEATRKLEKEAARLTYDQIVERNEADMVPIRQAIALDKINATALKPGSVIRGDAKPEKTTETAP